MRASTTARDSLHGTFIPSIGCRCMGIPDVTLRSVTKLLRFDDAIEEPRRVGVKDVWTAGAAFAARALQPGHRDGANLAAVTLKWSRIPLSGVEVLARMQSSEFGDASLELRVRRAVREGLIERLTSLQSWPESLDPAAEHSLSVRMDGASAQHLAALIIRLSTIDMSTEVRSRVCSRLVGEWESTSLPEELQCQRAEVLELKQRLHGLRDGRINGADLASLERLGYQVRDLI